MWWHLHIIYLFWFDMMARFGVHIFFLSLFLLLLSLFILIQSRKAMAFSALARSHFITCLIRFCTIFLKPLDDHDGMNGREFFIDEAFRSSNSSILSLEGAVGDATCHTFLMNVYDEHTGRLEARGSKGTDGYKIRRRWSWLFLGVFCSQLGRGNFHEYVVSDEPNCLPSLFDADQPDKYCAQLFRSLCPSSC